MRRRAAFTLIEMLAVVTIFALLASFAIPSLSSLSGRTLRQAAERFAAQIDLARQRSVMTGVPHRIVIDLDSHSYRMEWFVTESEGRGEHAAPAPPVYDLGGDVPLPLAPPRGDDRSFRPLPGRMGRDVRLEDDLGFARLETPEGWIDAGQSHLDFERDGTSSYTQIWMEDSAGNELAIDVLPMADAARIRDAT